MIETVGIVIGVIVLLVLIWLVLQSISGRAANDARPGYRSHQANDHYARHSGYQQPRILRHEGDFEENRAEFDARRNLADRAELRQQLLGLITEEADLIRAILFAKTPPPHNAQSNQSSVAPASDSALQQSATSRDDSRNLSPRQGSGSKPIQSDHFSRIAELYNEALNNQDARSEFRANYDLLMISVVNAIDRRRDERLDPVLKTASDGNFLAIKLPERQRYAVFPKFGLILQESSFGPGAVGDVFDCAGFNSRLSYPDIRVLRPAVFRPKGDDDWVLEKRGVLDIGVGREA